MVVSTSGCGGGEGEGGRVSYPRLLKFTMSKYTVNGKPSGCNLSFSNVQPIVL